MDNKIRVLALHPWMKDKAGIIKLLHIKDNDIINRIIVDEHDPRFVIVSEHIYKNPDYFNLFYKLQVKEDRIFIFYGGEAVYPDLNIFDYAIGFSRNTVDHERVSRIPTFCFFENTMVKGLTTNNLSFDDALKELREKKSKFCNFMYSNSIAHPMRDTLFYKISKYKFVESTGNHLNNTNVLPSRGEKNWAELSVKLKSSYKFVISSENAAFEGYTSEKIITSFQAHTIPIYWGNPVVDLDFNPEAYINANDFSSLDELVKYIEMIDNDDELWARIVSAPWQTEEQQARMQEEIMEYQIFLKNIFTAQTPKKIPKGTFADIYKSWFFRKYKKEAIYKRAIRKIGSLLGI